MEQREEMGAEADAMSTYEFAYWLQGYVEINGQLPSEGEWQIIKDHLQLVFTKVTPDRLLGPMVYRPPTMPSDISLPYKPIEVVC